MDDIDEKPKRSAPKPLQRRKLIEGCYNEQLATDTRLLAQHLDMPEKVVRRWQQRMINGVTVGWLSYPVTREDYGKLLIIRNFVWGNEEVMRSQFAQMPAARRELIVQGAGKSWIERVVLRDIVRYKLSGNRQYLTFDRYRNTLATRYPEGYKQLNADIFQRMKKAADYLIRKHRKMGELDSLAKTYGLKEVNGSYINPRAFVPKPGSGCTGDTNLPDDVLIPMPRPEADETTATVASPPAHEAPMSERERELRDYSYGAAFGGNVEHHKAQLEEKLKALANRQSPHK